MRKVVGWLVVLGLVVLALGVVHQALIFVSKGEGGAASAVQGTCAICHGG